MGLTKFILSYKMNQNEIEQKHQRRKSNYEIAKSKIEEKLQPKKKTVKKKTVKTSMKKIAIDFSKKSPIRKKKVNLPVNNKSIVKSKKDIQKVAKQFDKKIEKMKSPKVKKPSKNLSEITEIVVPAFLQGNKAKSKSPLKKKRMKSPKMLSRLASPKKKPKIEDSKQLLDSLISKSKKSHQELKESVISTSNKISNKEKSITAPKTLLRQKSPGKGKKTKTKTKKVIKESNTKNSDKNNFSTQKKSVQSSKEIIFTTEKKFFKMKSSKKIQNDTNSLSSSKVNNKIALKKKKKLKVKPNKKKNTETNVTELLELKDNENVKENEIEDYFQSLVDNDAPDLNILSENKYESENYFETEIKDNNEELQNKIFIQNLQNKSTKEITKFEELISEDEENIEIKIVKNELIDHSCKEEIKIAKNELINNSINIALDLNKQTIQEQKQVLQQEPIENKTKIDYSLRNNSKNFLEKIQKKALDKLKLKSDHQQITNQIKNIKSRDSIKNFIPPKPIISILPTIEEVVSTPFNIKKFIKSNQKDLISKVTETLFPKTDIVFEEAVKEIEVKEPYNSMIVQDDLEYNFEINNWAQKYLLKLQKKVHSSFELKNFDNQFNKINDKITITESNIQNDLEFLENMIEEDDKKEQEQNSNKRLERNSLLESYFSKEESIIFEEKGEDETFEDHQDVEEIFKSLEKAESPNFKKVPLEIQNNFEIVQNVMISNLHTKENNDIKPIQPDEDKPLDASSTNPFIESHKNNNQESTKSIKKNSLTKSSLNSSNTKTKSNQRLAKQMKKLEKFTKKKEEERKSQLNTLGRPSKFTKMNSVTDHDLFGYLETYSSSDESSDSDLE